MKYFCMLNNIFQAKHEKLLNEEYDLLKKGTETTQKLLEWYEQRLTSLEKRRQMLEKGMVALVRIEKNSGTLWKKNFWKFCFWIRSNHTNFHCSIEYSQKNLGLRRSRTKTQLRTSPNHRAQSKDDSLDFYLGERLPNTWKYANSQSDCTSSDYSAKRKYRFKINLGWIIDTTGRNFAYNHSTMVT